MNTVDAPTPALQINLLSNRSRCEALGRLRCGELLGGVLATAILCVSVRVLVSGVALMVEDSSPQSVKVEDEITQLQIELEHRRRELTALRDTRKDIAELETKKRAIAKMLTTFSSMIPTSVTIKSVTLTPFEISVAGVARDIEAVRQWMKEVVAACGGYAPSLEQLRTVQFGRVQAHEFAARIVRPQTFERLEPCVSGEHTGGL